MPNPIASKEDSPLAAVAPKAAAAAAGKIKVICAGLGRTGTLSLTEALQILGYKPYHYIDFKHASAWEDFVDGKNATTTVDDIIDLIVEDGYDAVLENPTCEIYGDILKRYPDAKVILTIRDTKEKFESSWKTLLDTMVVTEKPFRWNFPSFFGWIPLFRQLKKIRYFMGTTHLGLEPGSLTHGWRDKPAGWLAEQYDRHNQDVIDHVGVPSEDEDDDGDKNNKLLIFNVKQGWKPLCDFLECDVPKDLDFPHSKVNDAKSLKLMRRMFLIAVYGWIPTVVATATGAFLVGRHVAHSLSGARTNSKREL